MRPEFASADYKLRRAAQHMNVLKPEIEAWRNGDSYKVVTDYDPQTGKKTARFRCGEFPPPEWGPIIGDTLQGLRNALDHLVFGMAAACGPLTEKQAEEIAFPITGPKPLTADKANRCMRNVPVPVRDAIKSAQPHLHDDYRLVVLWVLHRLANIDKHRALHIVGLRVGGFSLKAPEGMEGIPTRDMVSPFLPKIQDGTVLAEYTPDPGAEGPEADVQIDLAPETLGIRYPPDVIFDEPGLAEAPVISVLEACGLEVVNVARAIAEIYERSLPKP